jgi:hypothetical protein
MLVKGFSEEQFCSISQFSKLVKELEDDLDKNRRCYESL